MVIKHLWAVPGKVQSFYTARGLNLITQKINYDKYRG